MGREKIELFITQFDGTWKNDDWVVPMTRALDGIGAREAAWQPPGEGNTIWQTLRHQNFYNERILNRLKACPLAERKDNTSTFGEPGNPEDEAGWQADKARSLKLSADLRDEISRLDDADLSMPFGESTAGEVLATWLAHDAFHCGQIVLLRKLQKSWPATIWP